MTAQLMEHKIAILIIIFDTMVSNTVLKKYFFIISFVVLLLSCQSDLFGCCLLKLIFLNKCYTQYTIVQNAFSIWEQFTYFFDIYTLLFMLCKLEEKTIYNENCKCNKLKVDDCKLLSFRLWRTLPPTRRQLIRTQFSSIKLGEQKTKPIGVEWGKSRITF